MAFGALDSLIGRIFTCGDWRCRVAWVTLPRWKMLQSRFHTI